jgi:hypothetical protein
LLNILSCPSFSILGNFTRFCCFARAPPTWKEADEIEEEEDDREERAAASFHSSSSSSSRRSSSSSNETFSTTGQQQFGHLRAVSTVQQVGRGRVPLRFAHSLSHCSSRDPSLSRDGGSAADTTTTAAAASGRPTSTPSTSAAATGEAGLRQTLVRGRG